MIGEGFELMLVGMGVVFSFLVMMVFLMKISGALLSKFPEPEAPVKPAAPGAGSAAGAGQKSASMAVAIATAYRARKGS
jgi:oxaloacetate decarboxylase gamma subunit